MKFTYAKLKLLLGLFFIMSLLTTAFAVETDGGGKWIAIVKEALWLEPNILASGGIPPTLEQGNKWLQVWVKITAPGKKNQWLEVRSIKVTDKKGSSYELQAVSWILYANDPAVFLFTKKSILQKPSSDQKATDQKGEIGFRGVWSTVYKERGARGFGPSGEGFFENGSSNKKRFTMALSQDNDDLYDRMELKSSPEDIVLLFCLPAGVEEPVLCLGTADPVALTFSAKK